MIRFNTTRKNLKLTAATVLAAASLTAAPAATLASSHNDAPLIKLDPQVNLTDVYAFVGTKYNDDSVEVLNVVANVRPFSEPGDGPQYERFSNDARYSLHIADPMTGESLIRYDFRFSPTTEGYKNLNTILSYGLGTEVGPIMMIDDARQNYTQTYTVTKVTDIDEDIATDSFVAPPNVGGNVTPAYNNDDGQAVSGAISEAMLDDYTAQAIVETASGEVFFAGPRDDSFYADVPGIFDLLNVRILDNNGSLDDGLGQDGGGNDGFKGFNVLTFAVQIPLKDLPQLAYNDAFNGPQMGVGVYASAARPRVRTLNADGTVGITGGFMQVNRLANPLFNEVLVPIADKDNYNVADPEDDAQFSTYAENPEVAVLINTVFATDFTTTGRADLAAVYIPDVIRVATTTGPVPLAGDDGFSRLGFIGGDTTGGVSSGWPNGRRFGDDVVDIALTAVASGPTYETITVVGDNIATNDLAFNAVFPYAATPHSGSRNFKDSFIDPGNPDLLLDMNEDGVVNTFDYFTFVSRFFAFDG